VGQYRANNFGLYDMIGNAKAWCSDWYDQEYYSKSPKHDPLGPSSGSLRVVRGASWYGTAAGCRSARREGDSPVERNFRLGFRLARNSGE